MLICYSSSPLSPSWTKEELRQGKLHLFLCMSPNALNTVPVPSWSSAQGAVIKFSVLHLQPSTRGAGVPAAIACFSQSPFTEHLNAVQWTLPVLIREFACPAPSTFTLCSCWTATFPPFPKPEQEISINLLNTTVFRKKQSRSNKREDTHVCLQAHLFQGCWPLLMPVGPSLPTCCPACMCQNAAKGLAPAGQSSWVPMLVLGNPPECLLMVRIPSIPSSSQGKRNTTRAIWNQARRCHIPRYWHVLHCHPKDSFLNKLSLLRFFSLLAYL